METDDQARRDSDIIWEAFMAYDFNSSGQISCSDLKKALERAGEPVTDDRTYWMIAMADPENTGLLTFF